MLSQVEAHRLAAAINQLRPDWAIASLSTWIRSNLAERAYRDAAIALTWVACDPETLTPARVLENGPWWKATQAQAGTVSALTNMCPVEGHGGWKAIDCPRTGPCGDAIRATDQKAELAMVRAAFADRPRTPTDHSEPIPERADRSKA